MITKEDIKAGVKLKLLCDRGKILRGKGVRSAGTVITIKSVDTANIEFEDTDGHVYWICDLQYFDLVASALPTDRPLTYDETQMLQAGDVIKLGMGMRKTTVLKICEYAIFETDSPYPWSIDKLKKSTCGTVYFVSRPEKAEVKEEKKEEVKEKITMKGLDFKPLETKTTKSVSDILYGRR